MANSIFLGPQYSGDGSDTLRAVEEKLNTDFGVVFAANPALASSRQIVRIAPGTDNAGPDTVPVTQSKINFMLAVLATQSGLSIAPIQLDPTVVGGISSAAASQLSATLAQLGAVGTLAALTLNTTAVTRSVAFTANISAATATSVLTASGLPTGLAINSGPRTITGTTVVTAGSYPIVVTETLAGKWASPKANNFTLVVT